MSALSGTILETKTSPQTVAVLPRASVLVVTAHASWIAPGVVGNPSSSAVSRSSNEFVDREIGDSRRIDGDATVFP